MTDATLVRGESRLLNFVNEALCDGEGKPTVSTSTKMLPGNKKKAPPAGLGNRNISDFFKRIDPAANSQPTSHHGEDLSSQTRGASPGVVQPQIPPATPATDMDSTRLSSDPSGADSASETLPTKSEPPSNNTTVSEQSAREVMDSEGEDSDSSLESLYHILGTRKVPEPTLARKSPRPLYISTPRGSRVMAAPYGSSPLSHRPKHRIDFKALAAHAKNDEAIEASSKRMKAMLAEAASSPSGSQDGDKVPVFAHEEVLDSVVAEQEDGGKDKVMNALRRTEATVEDTRWYFFDDDTTESTIEVRPHFPRAAVPDSMQNELTDPLSRYNTFTSGFAASMVELHQGLPDEILLWMWDELWHEDDNQLREAYFDVLKTSASSNQLGHLLDPGHIRSMYRRLGAPSAVTDVTQVVKPATGSKVPNAHQDWIFLRYSFRIFEALAPYIGQETRTYTIGLLLRMSADRMLLDNPDILVLYQDALRRMCRHMNDEAWEECVRLSTTSSVFTNNTQTYSLTTQLFHTITSPTLRHNILLSLPSTHHRMHNLRLQLSTAFFLNTLSHLNLLPLPLPTFTTHIRSCPTFRPTPRSDYLDLSALFHLLSIAVADGLSPHLFETPTFLSISTSTSSHPIHTSTDNRSSSPPPIQPLPKPISNLPPRPNLSTKTQIEILAPHLEQEFHHQIDDLYNALSEINVPQAGAGYVSRQEAKEMLESVKARIRGTLRLKERGKISLFDSIGDGKGGKIIDARWESGRGWVEVEKEEGKREELEGMKAKMTSFLQRSKEKGKEKAEEAVDVA